MHIMQIRLYMHLRYAHVRRSSFVGVRDLSFSSHTQHSAERCSIKHGGVTWNAWSPTAPPRVEFLRRKCTALCTHSCTPYLSESPMPPQSPPPPSPSPPPRPLPPSESPLPPPSPPPPSSTCDVPPPTLEDVVKQLVVIELKKAREFSFFVGVREGLPAAQGAAR